MGIRRWKDHKGRERIYLSKKWPDRTRLRRLMPNRMVAKKTRARIEESIAMGTWRVLKAELDRNAGEGELTIAQFKDLYFEQYCQVHNTRPDYKEHALKPIARILGGIRVKDFRRKHAYDFIAQRSKEVAPATVNRSLQELKNMLTFAVEKEYLDAHPLCRFRLLREEQHPLRILSVEEYRKLVDAVAEVDTIVGAYVAVLGETAIRKSEGLRLKWSDVDISRRHLTVGKSKSGLPRYIPLSEYAIEWLRSLPRVINCPAVFVRVERMKPWKDPAGPFQRGKKNAGLEWVRGFHDLRHFRATVWLANGMDPRTVSELLGHADLSTTMRYVHYLQEHATNAFRLAEERELMLVGGRKVDEGVK